MVLGVNSLKEKENYTVYCGRPVNPVYTECIIVKHYNITKLQQYCTNQCFNGVCVLL